MESPIDLFSSAGQILSILILASFLYFNSILPRPVSKVLSFLRTLGEDVVLTVFTATWMILTGFAYSCCVVWKLLLFVYIKAMYGQLGDTLDSMDAVGIVENGNSSVNINSLKVLKGPLDLENFRRRVLATVSRKDSSGQLVYPKFYQYLDQVTGYCCWKPSNFDINHHVRLLDGLEESDESLSESELLRWVSNISDSPFLPQRSPWEILVIPKFHYDHEPISPEPKFAFFIRIHHGIGDGYSFLKLIIRDTTLPGDDCVNCPIPEPPRRPHMPLWQGVLCFLLLTLRSARAFYKQILSRDDNPLFSSGRVISGNKVLCMSQPLSVPFLKEVKKKLGVGLSTTFLTALTSSIRKYIVEEFGEPPKSLSAVIPMPAPNHPDNRMTNKFSFIRFPLPGDEADPCKALSLVDLEGKKLARAPDGPMNLLLLRLIGALPTKYIRQLLRNKQSTLVISNLPGPSQNISVWGSQLLDTMFWLPCLGNSGISASCLSYKNHFRLGLTVDTGIIQDGYDGARRIVDGFIEAILAMAEECNVKSDHAFPQISNPLSQTSKLLLRSSSRDSSHSDSGSESEESEITSGHYSITSSDAEIGGYSGDEENKLSEISSHQKRQLRRSLSSSSSSHFENEEKQTTVVLRCNSESSGFYNQSQQNNYVNFLSSKS